MEQDRGVKGRKEALGTDQVKGEEHQSAWQQQQHEEVMTRLCHCVDTGMGEKKKSRLRASFLDQDTAREG